jgi:5-(carboxyamino)imidazole ribonucleotide mutase
MAAHLAGAVSATTVKPVIGVPMNASLDGLDALLSTVQMPAGIPVASVAIGKAGAKNAAYLATQILATADAGLGQKLRDERAANAEAIYAKDATLQASLKG